MIQELLLQRLDANEKRVIGELFIDGESYCYTVEDAIRKVKLEGKTAIPRGLYEVVLTRSPRAARGGLWTPWPDFALPLLVNVPGFEGIRVHSGNTAEDTEGCIIVGLDRLPNGVGNSRAALRRLVDDLKFPAHITIRNPEE
jgi:hypothetical protein